MKVLSFKAAELDKPIFDIFDTDDSLLNLCRLYVATEKAFPSREKLQSFAKDQGQELKYSAISPLLKDFTVKLLSGLNGSVVRVENDPRPGHSGTMVGCTVKNDRVTVEIH